MSLGFRSGAAALRDCRAEPEDGERFLGSAEGEHVAD
jgi:hypothetical protein